MTSPDSIAGQARERLQSSARDLYRNFEEAKKDGWDGFFRLLTSCGNVPKEPNVVDPHDSSSSSESCTPAQVKTEFGEHIYAQLFFDDQIRASKKTSVPKPFPVSSPTALSAPPVYDNEVNVPTDFDDAISAISAHTLEAMEVLRAPSVAHRQPSVDRSYKSTSTKSTESSSFDVWQKEDTKFWKQQARMDRNRFSHLSQAEQTLPKRKSSFSRPQPPIEMRVAEI